MFTIYNEQKRIMQFSPGMLPARIWAHPRHRPRPASGAGEAGGHSGTGAEEGEDGVVAEADGIGESRSRRRRTK